MSDPVVWIGVCGVVAVCGTLAVEIVTCWVGRRRDRGWWSDPGSAAFREAAYRAELDRQEDRP